MTISNALSDQLQQRANVADNNTPCDVCIQNGALVIDCTQSCDWWRVILDQDINSISLVGCTKCPDIDFIVPPNVCRKICGWQEGCNYIAEDCDAAVVCGGTTGRVAKSNGISLADYTGSGNSLGLRTESCPCGSALAAGCVTDCLRIQCCD